jgi:uroporphyrinogen decarboxylase
MDLMKLNCLPLHRPQPDAAEFVGIVMGERQSARVPLVEYLVDETVLRPVVTRLLGREWAPLSRERVAVQGFCDNFIAFWHRLGYDCVRFESGFDFGWPELIAADTAQGVHRNRAWADEHKGAIRSWDDFERYPWPTIEQADFSIHEYLDAHLPDGMGLLTCHGGGVFEHVSRLFSLEGLCLALYEAPDLVEAVTARVGELLLAYYGRLAQLKNLSALFQGDDMGFKTQTLIGPDHLRQYFLPWHKRFAELAHGRGVPYFLHSCGNLLAIMDDLIDDVGIDAKHSYEDAIIPVEQFQARYRDRIGILGGVDINILTQATPDGVRARTRHLIETCGRRGRYAVGSGNSIPSYIPVDNYLAMVDEAAAFAR